MTVRELARNAYEVKEVLIMDAVHNTTTGKESVNEYTTNKWCDNLPNDVQTADVMMFRAIKKDVIKIWAYREIAE